MAMFNRKKVVLELTCNGVFLRDYRFMSVKSCNAFIKANKELLKCYGFIVKDYGNK